MEKEDIVIASLKFARMQLLAGALITKVDLMNFLGRECQLKSFSDPQIDALFSQIINTYEGGFNRPNGMMKLDAYLGLLDYEELQLARQDSQEARKEAKEAMRLTKEALFYTKWSLWIASAVGILQVILASIQLLK